MTHTRYTPTINFTGGTSFYKLLNDKGADFDALYAMKEAAGGVDALAAIYKACEDAQDWTDWGPIESAGMAAAWNAIKEGCNQDRLDRIENAFYNQVCLEFSL